MADQELVKGAQGAKAKLNGGAAQAMAPEETEIGAEIIPPQFLPSGRLLALLLVPGIKSQQRLPVITLCVSRSAAIRGEVREKFLDPAVAEFGFGRFRVQRSLLCCFHRFTLARRKFKRDLAHIIHHQVSREWPASFGDELVH